VSIPTSETVRGPFRFVSFPLSATRYSCDVWHTGVRQFTAYGDDEAEALAMATAILDAMALASLDGSTLRFND